MSTTKAQVNLLDEIIVDNFAGGGGASTGMELATGKPVAIAINHDPAAILMHRTNHPYTEHLQASVWDVDPEKVTGGRPVGLAWFSPDCKHFSKAKGAALVDRNIRGLAWIVLRWAGTVRPRVIILENVEEFQTWGPVRKGKPIKKKSGETFRKWKQQLSDLGYEIDHRELVAADFGAPTTRKRFYLIARCDGKPIVWPEPTHAPRDSEAVKTGQKKPWRSAAEIIDWNQPMYSIFASRKEIKEKFGVNVVRPLADNTMRRIIRGVDKFTLKFGQPFLVPTGYGERSGQKPRVHNISDPLPTVVSSGKHNLVGPVMAPATFSNTGGSVGSPVKDPVGTIRTAGGQVLAAANLMSIGQTGGSDRIRSVENPTPTVVSKQETCLIATNLVECNHSGAGHISSAEKPLGTITQKCTMGICAANLIQYHTEQTENVRANGLKDPLPTADGSNRYGFVAVNLVEYFSNGRPLDISEPMHTATSHDREALTAAFLQPMHAGGYTGRGNSPEKPLNTVTASGGNCMAGAEIRAYQEGADFGHWPEIRHLLNRYCGYQLKSNEIILLTIGGREWFLYDISMRMLTPRELYSAMGFPPDYKIDRDYTGKPYPKNQQVARCGNAVCPAMAEALVRANVPEMCGKTYQTMKELTDDIAV